MTATKCPTCNAAIVGSSCPWCTTEAFKAKAATFTRPAMPDRDPVSVNMESVAKADLEREVKRLTALAAERSMETKVMAAVAERVAVARAEEIRQVRRRLMSLLRPVVDDDFTDEELEGLANAMMATMATLGGNDVKAIFT